MNVNTLTIRQANGSYSDPPQASVKVAGWSGGSLTAGQSHVTLELTPQQAGQLLTQLAEACGLEVYSADERVALAPPAGRRPDVHDSDVCLH